jgi:hypothetical protein
MPEESQREAAQHKGDVQDGKQHQLVEAVEGPQMGGQILICGPLVLDDIGHDDFPLWICRKRSAATAVALAAGPGNIMA